MARRPSHDLAPDLARAVGERLRERRHQLSRTLAEVAQPAGVSVSYLSAIEKGSSLPSLPTLARVTAALGLPLSELLRQVGGDRAVAHRRRLLPDRPGSRRLSSGRHGLVVSSLVAPASRRGGPPVPVAAADVFVYVLAGSVSTTVDGVSYTLHAGDSLDAEAPGAVTYEVVGDGPAVMVWAAAASGWGEAGQPSPGGGEDTTSGRRR